MASEGRQLLLDGFPAAAALPAPMPTRTPRLVDPNPCVQVYGPGPVGATCATCAALVRLATPQRAYPKCQRRGVSHSPRLDHRTGWPACGRYESKEVNPDGND